MKGILEDQQTRRRRRETAFFPTTIRYGTQNIAQLWTAWESKNKDYYLDNRHNNYQCCYPIDITLAEIFHLYGGI